MTNFTGARIRNSETGKTGTVRKYNAGAGSFDVLYDDGAMIHYTFPRPFRTVMSFTDPQLQKELENMLAGKPNTKHVKADLVNSEKLTEKDKVLECSVRTGLLPAQKIVIVKDPQKQNSNHGIYWLGRGKAKAIFSAIACGEREFEDEGILWTVDKITFFPDYAEEEKKWKQLHDASVRHTLTVFRHKGVYDDASGGYELVTAAFYFPKKDEVYEVAVYYQSRLGSYFMNEESYSELVRQHGEPKANILYINGTGSGNSSWNLREESTLMQLGYNVRQSDGASDNSRQALLRHIIQNGLMKDFEVTEHLERLIHLNEGKDNMTNACACWREDLRYVQHSLNYGRRKVDFTGRKAEIIYKA